MFSSPGCLECKAGRTYRVLAMDYPAGTSSHCSKGPRRANLLSHFLCCKALNRFSIFSKILDVFSFFFFLLSKGYEGKRSENQEGISVA